MGALSDLSSLLALRLCGGIAQQLRKLRAIGIMLVATHLRVLIELLPELRPRVVLIGLVFLLLM